MRIHDLIASQQRPDPPGAAERRIAERKASELAVADRKARFPEITSENFDAALAYQEERARHHLARAKGGK